MTTTTAITTTPSTNELESLENDLQQLTLQAIEKHPTKSKSEFALEFFELATKKETMGSLNEAINYYRKAFKIDEKVDVKYRERLVANQPTPEIRLNSDGSISAPTTSNILKKLDLSKIKVKPLLKSFQDSEIYPIDETKPIYLNNLPDEILLTIMESLVYADTASWFNFSMVCKKLAYMGFYESSSWRLLSNLIYPNQNYSEEEIELNGIKKDQSLMVGTLWNNDWRQMLCERPYIKYNGLYISVVNYQREGGRSELSNAWNLPFRIITYYRYFRFFPDGSCLKLMTIIEPSEIVGMFDKDWREHFGKSEWEKVYEGVWNMTIDGLVRCESNGAAANYKFIDEFKIVNGGKYSKHHKLEWIRMGFENVDNGDFGALGIGNERSFAFSRVKSYNVY